MLRCSAGHPISAIPLLMLGLVVGVGPISAQGGGANETARRYEAVVMEVLSTRLASDVAVENGRVSLRTPVARTMKELKSIVQASVPYYLEGSMAEFRRFRPRVAEALGQLDGWSIPPAPDDWEPGEWAYFQVQGALEDVLLLVALDVGVFANGALAAEVRASAELETDWSRIRGGSDPLQPRPLPDFGGGSGDASQLPDLGGGAGVSGGDNPSEDNSLLEDLAAALRELTLRIDALESRSTPSARPSGGFPNRGVDGGWQPTSGRPVQGGGAASLPEQFTLQFPAGSAALGLSAEYGLNTLVEWMVAYPELRVLVTGHSDAVGSARENMTLSRRRAQIVRYYLLERGIAADRVTAAHFGEERPEWGAGFDRRVEVRLFWD